MKDLVTGMTITRVMDTRVIKDMDTKAMATVMMTIRDMATRATRVMDMAMMITKDMVTKVMDMDMMTTRVMDMDMTTIKAMGTRAIMIMDTDIFMDMSIHERDLTYLVTNIYLMFQQIYL